MISEDSLTKAVEEGLLTPHQVESLRALETARLEAGAEPQDPEAFRFIMGFADIFVSIGVLMFLSSCGWFLGLSGNAALAAAGLAALSWGLAEFFTRRRRMALPSILLLVAFTAAAFSTAAIVLGGGMAGLEQIDESGVGWVLTGAGLFAAGAAALHYWRFRVPITIAAGFAALSGAAIGVLAVVAPALLERAYGVVLLAAGLLAFALAMHFDLTDRERVTRRTDIAFWLHLLAAPLIVHPLVMLVFGPENAANTGVGGAAGLLAMFAALSLVALLVDRRALLVSGLLYAGIAVAQLLQGTGFEGQAAPGATLALGAFVLFLSAGWRPLRRVLLARLPDSLSRRLPPAADDPSAAGPVRTAE